MNCTKCGRETADGQVFCEECLKDMDNYPVAPGTPVHIPTQPHQTMTHRKVRRISIDPEEQVHRLRKALHRLIACLILLLIAWAATAGMLLYTLWGEDKVPIGQNYSVSTTNSGTTD